MEAGAGGQWLLTCLMVRFPSSIQPARGCSLRAAAGRAEIHQVSHRKQVSLPPLPCLLFPPPFLFFAGGGGAGGAPRQCQVSQPSSPSLWEVGSGEATVRPALISNRSAGMELLAEPGRGTASPIRGKGRAAESIKAAAYTRIRKAFKDLKD